MRRTLPANRRAPAGMGDHPVPGVRMPVQVFGLRMLCGYEGWVQLCRGGRLSFGTVQ